MDDTVRRDARLEARDEVSSYRRIEVITGRRQRRSWSDAEKAQIVSESAEPGANISAVARRYGLNRGLLTTWRRQAGVVDPPPVDAGFVPVEVEGPTIPAERADPGSIDVDLRAGRVTIRGSVDPAFAV
jgi:transposase